MKYVILRAELKTGVERVYPFVFAEYCTHSEVARYMHCMVAQEVGLGVDILSAGFCEVAGDQFVVTRHGSESLQLRTNRALVSRDEKLLNLPNAMQGLAL